MPYIEFAPTEFTGPNLAQFPKITRIDPIEAGGSLMLVDANHPMGSWPSGVTDGTKLTNIFEANADLLAGSADHRATISNLMSGKGVVERTTKGGIHTIVSPTLATGSRDSMNIWNSPGIKAYMKANPTHEFYFSAWAQYTKAAVAGTNMSALIRAALSSDGQFAFAFNQLEGFMGTGTRTGHVDPTNTVGPKLISVGGVSTTAWVTGSDGLDQRNNTLWNGGNRQPETVGKTGANVFYRGYIEDVTVSGRTFAQVSAIDQTLYNKHVLTVGGRYYGDTWSTDPTTVA